MQDLEEKLASERKLRDAAESQALKLQAEISQLSAKLAKTNNHSQQLLSAEQQKLADALQALSEIKHEAESLRQENGMFCIIEHYFSKEMLCMTFWSLVFARFFEKKRREFFGSPGNTCSKLEVHHTQEGWDSDCGVLGHYSPERMLVHSYVISRGLQALTMTNDSYSLLQAGRCLSGVNLAAQRNF